MARQNPSSHNSGAADADAAAARKTGTASNACTHQHTRACALCSPFNMRTLAQILFDHLLWVFNIVPTSVYFGAYTHLVEVRHEHTIYTHTRTHARNCADNACSYDMRHVHLLPPSSLVVAAAAMLVAFCCCCLCWFDRQFIFMLCVCIMCAVMVPCSFWNIAAFDCGVHARARTDNAACATRNIHAAASGYCARMGLHDRCVASTTTTTTTTAHIISHEDVNKVRAVRTRVRAFERHAYAHRARALARVISRCDTNKGADAAPPITTGATRTRDKRRQYLPWDTQRCRRHRRRRRLRPMLCCGSLHICIVLHTCERECARVCLR